MEPCAMKSIGVSMQISRWEEKRERGLILVCIKGDRDNLALGGEM